MNSRLFFQQFVKFGIVGFFTTLISYGVYSLLVFLGFAYLVANICGFAVGTLNSFIWNSLFVFKKTENQSRNPFFVFLKTFFTYGVTNLLLSSFLLFLLVEKVGVSKYMAPVLVLMVTVPVNFLLNKFWAYRLKENLQNGK